MDALLIALKDVCSQLLPILGAVVLIFLCIALKKLGLLLEAVTNKVNQLDTTVKRVEESLTKVQAPLDTAVKYSHTLDKVHDKASDVAEKIGDFAQEGMAKFQQSETVENLTKEKMEETIHE